MNNTKQHVNIRVTSRKLIYFYDLCLGLSLIFLNPQHMVQKRKREDFTEVGVTIEYYKSNGFRHVKVHTLASSIDLLPVKILFSRTPLNTILSQKEGG